MPQIKKDYSPDYNGPHLAGAAYGALVFNPSDVQLPGDIETIGQPVVFPGPLGISRQEGKIKQSVNVTYPDGHVLEFPANSKVDIYRVHDEIDKIVLQVDGQGRPVPAPQQAGRRRSVKRRSAKRRSTRRRRGSRRH